MGRLSNPPFAFGRAVETLPIMLGREIRRVRRGTSLQFQRWLTEAEQAELVEQFKAGSTPTHLARSFKIHRETVYQLLKRREVPLRGQCGRLSAEQVEQAADRYRDGETLARLATAYDVDPSTVRIALIRAGASMRPRGRRPGT